MKNFIPILIVTLIAHFVNAQNKQGFEFILSSNGLNNPVWESGMAELEFADINNDGFVDILSIGDHGSPNSGTNFHGINVWFGDGQGNWSVQATGNFGYGGLAIGDVNNDGFLDVGYGMHHNYSSDDFGNQRIEVALGDGSGINWTPYDDGLATNGESWGMFGTDFADIDNDGDLDIGCNSFGSTDDIHIYLNNGDGSWTQSAVFNGGNSIMRFLFGDLNNDGNQDFTLTNEPGMVYFGNGTGSFVLANYNLPTYTFPFSGADLADVNRDGALDLGYINPNGGIKVWTFSNEQQQWIDLSASLPQTGDFQELQFADFDKDGIFDLSAFGNGFLSIWKGSMIDEQQMEWSQEFTLTTASNGDCAAFRVGGDVDRNGFADMVLVQKEGNWPNDINHLHCYKESSPYTETSFQIVYPLGKQVFKQNSVQFSDWLAAVPEDFSGSLSIDLSVSGIAGPWLSLDTAASISGRLQWTVPETMSSNNCYLRYTLINQTDTIITVTPQSFTILGSEGLNADFSATKTTALVFDTIWFFDQTTGITQAWEWDFQNDGSYESTYQNPWFIYTEPGNYSVKLKATDNNTFDEEIKINYIEIHLPDGTSQMVNSSPFEISPNPTSSVIYLTSTQNVKSIHIKLYNLSGQLVSEWSFNSDSTQISTYPIQLTNIPPGVYEVLVQLDNDLYHKKLLILKR